MVWRRWFALSQHFAANLFTLPLYVAGTLKGATQFGRSFTWVPPYRSARLFRRHANRAIEPDDFSVKHYDGEDRPNKLRVFRRTAQA